MVLSMTGYGKVTETFQGKKIVVEIRSLNSKSLDLNLKTLPLYREIELEIRTIISELLDRGKVEASINIENTSDTKNYTINKELAKSYHQDIKNLSFTLNEPINDIFSLILRMPEIFSNDKEKLSDEESDLVQNLVKKACENLIEFRKQEGEQLRKDFTKNIKNIEELLGDVQQYEQERITTVKDRIKTGLEKLESQAVDLNRLEQELIFYIEKMDVSEEKMRLLNHLQYFQDTMKVPLSGKKLGFIAQEIGREINTLGSKANHVEIQKLVVEMKDNLEKIKEQVLNTL
jgi:uncharacterized protein (TIGR00255 family)